MAKIYRSVMDYTNNSAFIWNKFNSVIVLYKPPEEHILQVKNTLKANLCRDLNRFPQRPPIAHVQILGKTHERMKVVVSPSFAEHPLVCGPDYEMKDIKMVFANRLYHDTCGVLVVGINAGKKIANKITEGRPVSFYTIKGTLGKATDNYFHTGKVGEKTTWKHVRRHHIDQICASIQSTYTKSMFQMCGLPIQSQAAYELAAQGPIRPSNTEIPVIYSLKCVEFNPPNFTIEVVCINEQEMFLKEIIHDIGMQVRSTAYCTHLQCTQYGLFTLQHALLKKDWTLKDICQNMADCKNLLDQNKFLVEQKSPILKEYSSLKQIQDPSTKRFDDSSTKLIKDSGSDQTQDSVKLIKNSQAERATPSYTTRNDQM